jgi:N-acetylneuraminate synthase/sialic acid synthase
MVDAAKKAGASAVKFQTRNPRALYAPELYDKPFDSPHAFGPTVGAHREAIEFDTLQWWGITGHCQHVGMTWFSTPFDFPSVNLLAELECPIYKVASGDATNIPMIEHIASFRRPMIVSTGGCSLADCERIVKAVGNSAPLALLHCTCVYPARADVLNLRAISTMREAFPNTVIGLSHHYPEWAQNVAAYALGARIFEQHFTLDRTWKGTDQAFSLTPPMLADCVEALAETHVALGTGIKTMQHCEFVPATERQKALRWSRNLPAGHIVEADDIAIQCPGGGLQPWEENKVIGSRLIMSVRKDGLISLGTLESRWTTSTHVLASGVNITVTSNQWGD